MGKSHAVDYVTRARCEYSRRREKFPRSASFRYIADIAVMHFMSIATTMSVDFNILKQEMLRTIDDLQQTIKQAEQQLNDDAPKDEEQLEASTRSSIQARLSRLGFMRTKLSRALHNAKGHWESALQAIAQFGEEDHRKELYREVRLHWDGHGGHQAIVAAEDLLCHFDNAIQLLTNPLPLRLPPQLPQAEMPRIATPARLSPSRMLQDTPALTDAGTRHEDHRPRETVRGSDQHLPLRHAHSEEEIPSGRRETLPRATSGFNPSCSLPLDFRLPEFTLPTFVGEIEKFPEFWDAFNSATHSNPSLSSVAKFHHLKSLLKGDAQAIVAGYDITASNYECAILTLRETYYRPQLIRVQLGHKLKDMKPASSSPLHQRTTLAQIKSLWIQLQKLGDHEDNIFVMCLIREKFPPRTLEHLGGLETADPTPWRVPELLAGLDRAIKTFETIADTTGGLSVQYHTLPVHSPHRGRSPARSLPRQSSPGGAVRGRSPNRDSSLNYRFTRYRSSSRSLTPVRPADSPRRNMRCAFCRRQGHLTALCHLVATREARMEVVIDDNLCRRCFAKGHAAASCDAPPCPICGRDHHETLCWKSRASNQGHGDSRAGMRSVRTRRPTPVPGRSTDRSSAVYRRQSRSPSANSRYPSREVSFSHRNQYIPRRRSSSRDSRQNVLTATCSDSEDDLEAAGLQDSAATIHIIPSTSIINYVAPPSSDPRLMIVTSRSRNNVTRMDEILVMLLDSGAQHSFIKEDTAKRLGLHFSDPCPITTRGFGGHTATEMSSIVSIVLRDQSDVPMRLRLRTRRVTTSVSLRSHIPQEAFVSFQGMQTISPQFSGPQEQVDVDILVGIDYYWSIVDPSKTRRLPSGLTLVSTRFGPVLSGQPHSCSESITATVSSVNTLSHTDEPDLRRLWDLESLGIYDDPGTQYDDEINRQVVKRFYDTVQVIDGIIYVQFPWKQNHPPLPDNKLIALRRLEQQYESLHVKKDLWKTYCTIFENHLTAGIIEDVEEFVFDGPKVYYMPHQAVVKTDSSTTALRIVFDASSHFKGHPSLNDCLHQGPSLLPDLSGALLRTRLSRYLLTADVEKAFHQIRLQPDQKDATRLLWLKDVSRPPTSDNLRILRFTRVVFGINVSPFLLNISIKYALERDSQNSIRDEVLANIYVDNVLIGANTTAECIEKQRDCKRTFGRMAMNLREFMSNNPQVMQSIPMEDRMKIASDTAKLLGIRWNPLMDTFHVTAKLASFRATTKRTVLRAVASNFDPLGYLTPLFIPFKVFIQDLWRRKQDWDQPLCDQDVVRWQELAQRIEGYTCSVPRFILFEDVTAEYELLLFADASKQAYAAVAYLLCRSPERTQSNLIMAKARVAPLDEVTIPRLELMACHCAVLLAQYLHKELKIPIRTVRFFSDSHIALYWIHSNRPLKTFVANRVEKIRTVLDSFAEMKVLTAFHYINTEANPADCATRGLSSREISEHIWWKGPPYVCLPLTEWPESDVDFMTQPSSVLETDLEYRETTVTSTSTHKSVLPFARTNRYDTLVRITAYILRFIRIMVYDKVSTETRSRIDESLPLEAHVAELILAREHQREAVRAVRPDIYRDSLGIIRVNTRMRREQIPFHQDHPILLATNHPFTAMIINFSHLKLHHAGMVHIIAALRPKFFIPRIRRTVKSVLSRCTVCKRQQGRPYRYPNTPDLPVERITRSRPFQNVGLDYFGPVQVIADSQGIRKVWVCLLTCMTTRALHLELVYDNTAHEFLLAFRRFIARRGTPDLLVSDNASTFKLGREILTNQLLHIADHTTVTDFTTKNSLRWHFITPLSPWKGGFYERLVGMVKKALWKTVRRNTLNIRIFETLIVEIEATLNTRPLASSGDASFLRPIDLISPFYHLGLFTASGSLQESPFIVYDPSDSQTKETLKEQHDSLITALDYFWNLWREDYLQTLAQGQQKPIKNPQGSSLQPTVGDLVIVKTDDMPRAHWPLAVITRLNVSNDGSIRSVQIRTGKNTFMERSVKHLIPLELHVHEIITADLPPIRQQPPRRAKRVKLH